MEMDKPFQILTLNSDINIDTAFVNGRSFCVFCYADGTYEILEGLLQDSDVDTAITPVNGEWIGLDGRTVLVYWIGFYMNMHPAVKYSLVYGMFLPLVTMIPRMVCNG